MECIETMEAQATETRHARPFPETLGERSTSTGTDFLLWTLPDFSSRASRSAAVVQNRIMARGLGMLLTLAPMVAQRLRCTR